MAQAISDAEFQKEVLQSNTPVLVDFWASWCGPCKSMLPIVEELASEYEGKAKIVKLNIDENTETAGQYGVMSIPTFILFKDGAPVKTIVGMQTKEAIQQELDAVI